MYYVMHVRMFNISCVIQKITSGIPPQVKKENSNIYAGLKSQCTLLGEQIGSRKKSNMPDQSLVWILHTNTYPASVSSRGATPHICFLIANDRDTENLHLQCKWVGGSG